MRVLLVDPSELFRLGVRAALVDEEDLHVVGDVGAGAEALELFARRAPDVVVTETRLVDTSGAELTRALVQRRPDAKVLVVSTADDEVTLRAVIGAGATGYLLKDLPAAELAGALRSVAAGRRTVTSSLAPKLMSGLASVVQAPEPAAPPAARLSEREVEVLRQVARGLSNRAVGAALFVSENTVKNHMGNIMEKLGVHTRTEAVLHAARAGLLDP